MPPDLRSAAGLAADQLSDTQPQEHPDHSSEIPSQNSSADFPDRSSEKTVSDSPVSESDDAEKPLAESDSENASTTSYSRKYTRR